MKKNIKKLSLIALTLTIASTSVNAMEERIYEKSNIKPNEIEIFIKNRKKINNKNIQNKISQDEINKFKSEIKRQNKRYSKLKRKEKRISQKRKYNNDLSNIKLSYVNKINKIETCVLRSETIDELEICNKRIYNLSNKIGKIERRIKKMKKNY